MNSIKINSNGKVEELKISKTTMAEKFGLNIRDLRPVYSALQVSTFLPRKNVLIINLGKYKAVVSKDVAYFIFHNNKELILNFLEKVKNKIPEKKDDFIFYLFVLEKILDEKYKEIKEKNNLMHKEAQNTLSKIKKSFHEHDLEPLVRIKKRVLRNESVLAEILSAVKEVLDDEENFNELISLGDNYHLNSFEAESVLENFLEELEDEISNLHQIKESLEHGQEIINLTLSIRRTKIGRIDLFATIISLIMGILAVVVGLYGVNLKNNLENSDIAFFALSLFLIIFVVISGVFSFWYLKKKKVI